MAFRTQAKACAYLIAFSWAALSAFGQTSVYPVRHRHLFGGSMGKLSVGAESISFTERGHDAAHSRQWRYDDIQRLVLEPTTLQIVTYEDRKWELGRDRVYDFDRIPPDFARHWYPFFAKHLDRRFIAALSDENVKAQWTIPAKLLKGRSGAQGVLRVASDAVVFQTDSRRQSRTWRISDINAVSSADPLELTITTRERDFRFALKQELTNARFNELWRRVTMTSKGLQILSSTKSTGEQQ